MIKISEDLVEKLRKAGIEEDVIREIVQSGDERKAKLLLDLAELEKGPLVSLEEAAKELGITLK